MVKKRKAADYMWRVRKESIQENIFIERHAQLHNMKFADAYHNVMTTMITLQDMLCRKKMFLLPAIGIIGISRGGNNLTLTIRSTIWWWAPTFLNTINQLAGWEGAPLNKHLTDEHIAFLKKLRNHNKNPKDDMVTLRDRHFSKATDRDMAFPTSLDLLTYYEDPKRKAVGELQWVVDNSNRVYTELKTKIHKLEKELAEAKARD